MRGAAGVLYGFTILQFPFAESGSTCPSGELVAKQGSPLVFLGSHRVGQLLREGPGHLVLVAEPILEFPKLRRELVCGRRGVDRFIEVVDPLQSSVDFFNGRLNASCFEMGQRCCLRAMEKYEFSLPCVFPFWDLGVPASLHEVEKAQGVVGVGDGAVELAYGQPADPPVVVLGKLPVDLLKLLVVQFARLAVVEGFLEQPVQVGFRTSRPGSVGTPRGFHLQDTQIDSHLEYVASV